MMHLLDFKCFSAIHAVGNDTIQEKRSNREFKFDTTQGTDAS